jgi:signal transduction histidine kinase
MIRSWRLLIPRSPRPKGSLSTPPGTPLRLRLRLTLFYGVLSILSGVALLVIMYLLVKGSGDESRATVPNGVRVHVEVGPDGRPAIVPFPPDAPGPPNVPNAPNSPEAPIAPNLRQPRFAVPPIQESRADLYNLLILAGIALAIMALFSIALGWLIAGRVLRPVRTMTDTLRQISARNLHERLAVTGSRNEIKDLGDTIDGLLARLEVALDGHKRFVANAAHELRTPLAVEHALLEEPLIDPDVTLEHFRSNFERLLAISQQRGRLLESLLTLSGSEHGREHYQPLELDLVVEQVLRNQRLEVDRLGLQVDPLIVPVRILGDQALIERLVANVLDNAVHHNHANGWVEIGTRSEPGRVVFFIANSGPVVPPEQVERLIEPFQRLQRVADDGHHGLGLSIVDAIASAHDATLTVSARLTGGLFVEVEFPVAASESATHVTSEKVPAP